MGTKPNGASVLNIDCLHAQMHAPAEHPCRELLRQRSQEQLCTELPGALAAHLRTYFSPLDPGLWFLRRLDFQLDLCLERISQAPAAAWASPFVRALDHALKDPSNPELVHFPSAAAYWAAFLCDLAFGSAWNKWYYSRFDGLRHLSASAAIRTCVCTAPDTSLAALKSLTSRALSNVLRVLTAFDSRLILEAFSTGAASESPQDAFRSVANQLRAGMGRESSGTDRVALEIFLSTARAAPELPAPDLCMASRAWARLLHRPQQSLSPIGTVSRDHLLDVLHSETKVEELVQLLASHAKDGPDHAAEIAAHDLTFTAERAGNSSDLSTRTSTSLGGMFLLLSITDRLDWETICQSWPNPKGCSSAALSKMTILLKCFGKENAGELFFDVVLRRALGIPTDFTAKELRDWQRRLRPEDLLHLKRSVSESVAWETGAVATEVRLARVTLGGWKIVLALGSASGHWLDVLYGERHIHSLPHEELLRRLSLRVGSVTLGRKQEPGLAANPHEDPPTPELSISDSARLVRDLRFLLLGREFCAGRAVESAFSVAARNILYGLAGRIRALASSSCSYLRDNLLLSRATMTEERDRFAISMMPPPLHIALSTAGFSQFTVQLTDSCGRTVAVPVRWEE